MVLDTSSTLGSFAASSSGWSPSLSFALLLVPILCSSSLSIYFVSRVSTLQDSLTLWCLSRRCADCGSGRVCLGCPVVFLCQFHVSCVRIVGMASFSIPLFVLTRNAVFLASWECACRTSCGLAQLIPELFKDILSVVALLASKHSLGCLHPAVPTVCLAYS